MTTSLHFFIMVLIASTLTLFLLDRILKFRIKKLISEAKTPLAIDLLKAGLFICGGLVLSEVLPIIQVLTKVLSNSYLGSELLIKEATYFSVFLGITLVFMIMLLWLSAVLYTVFSKGRNIFIEAVNNDLASVILLLGMLIGLVLSCSVGLTSLLEQLIPYPIAPIYH